MFETCTNGIPSVILSVLNFRNLNYFLFERSLLVLFWGEVEFREFDVSAAPVAATERVELTYYLVVTVLCELLGNRTLDLLI